MHNHCQHELTHCQQCNMVYCSKCGQEWGAHAHAWPVVPPFVRTYPWWEWRPTWYVEPSNTGTRTWTSNTSGSTTLGHSTWLAPWQ